MNLLLERYQFAGRAVSAFRGRGQSESHMAETHIIYENLPYNSYLDIEVV